MYPGTVDEYSFKSSQVGKCQGGCNVNLKGKPLSGHDVT